jgi:hypothetical protein
MLGIGCTQSSITAPALTVAAEELLDGDARYPVRARFVLRPQRVEEGVVGSRAGSDDAVLFERGDLGGRQSEPVAVDLTVVLAELGTGHGVDRVGAVDA